MAKAMVRASGDARKGRTTLSLLTLGGAAWLLQAVAFALTGAPRLSPNPKVLTARGAEEEGSVGFLPSKMVDLRVGQELQGIVTQVQQRIALVDVGVEKVGLLPISKLVDGRPPETVSDKLSEGQPITVYVAEVQNPDRPKDRDSKFVLAAHKNKIVNPYQLGNASNIEDLKALVAEQKGKEEKVYYTGVVTAKKDPGIIVSFRIPDVDGITTALCYRTEVKGEPQVLDQVQVRILDVVDGQQGRRPSVKLSMRDEDPLTGAAAKFGDFRELVDKTVKGKVIAFEDYGAFVEVTSESGSVQKALLRNQEIKTEDGSIPQDPAEVLEVDQELPLKILEISEKGILVSAKQAEA